MPFLLAPFQLIFFGKFQFQLSFKNSLEVRDFSTKLQTTFRCQDYRTKTETVAQHSLINASKVNEEFAVLASMMWPFTNCSEFNIRLTTLLTMLKVTTNLVKASVSC